VIAEDPATPALESAHTLPGAINGEDASTRGTRRTRGQEVLELREYIGANGYKFQFHLDALRDLVDCVQDADLVGIERAA
jgi:hypothetical protein